MKTYYGIKQEMTQSWDKDGKRIPVTVVKTEPLTVTQTKTMEKDGYVAVQVGFGEKKKLNKPMTQHLKGAKSNLRYLRELNTDQEVKVGDVLKVEDVLSEGDEVIVRSVSKGKGFAGVMQRWGFKGGPRTHGQSDRARAPGSIGQGTDPGRVHKGKKMPGRYGNQQFAIRSLQVIKIDEENNLVWISGPIPGSLGSVVKLMKTGEVKFAGLYHQQIKDGVAVEEEKEKVEVVTEPKEENVEKKTEANPEEKEAVKTEDEKEKKDD